MSILPWKAVTTCSVNTEYRKNRDKMYKDTEWVKIWEWVKKQSPAD